MPNRHLKKTLRGMCHWRTVNSRDKVLRTPVMAQTPPRRAAHAVRLWSDRKPHSLLAGMKAGQALWKTVWQILRQLNIS